MFQNEIMGIGEMVSRIKIEKESYRLQPIYAFYVSVWCFVS